MGDADLRELERRWRETGSVEDEAAWLLERVRVGDLERGMLELAAYFGHRAARAVLQDDAPEMPDLGGVKDRSEVRDLQAQRDFAEAMGLDPSSDAWSCVGAGVDPDEIREWCQAFVGLGAEACVRAAWAAAESSLHTWQEENPTDPRPKRALLAAGGWILCPCSSHAEAAGQAAIQASRAANEAEERNVQVDSSGSALISGNGHEVARILAALGSTPSAPDQVANAAALAVEFHGDNLQVWETIRTAVEPWALGYSDPVRERVEARRREAARE
ncbi:MAG: hypothetical protein JKY65_11545 [Planctomycetes bacterium]|nr:hypothetical protein [Planctomycetota bacterium]